MTGFTKHPEFPMEIQKQHMAILGKTGSGKTSTAKLFVELMAYKENARVCILDPIKSDWWGMTLAGDGINPALPFNILGGPKAHVPLNEHAGKAIAEVVASGALKLSILDMADFAPGGQSKFFVEFAPTLLRKMRGVLYLVIEEAHLFAPKERSGIGAENMAIHWAKTLATAGRSKGIRLVVLTQRTQALHNAILGSCDTLIAHRLTAPADQDPVMKWLKANTSKEHAIEVEKSLSSLKTGEAWVCSGEAKIFHRTYFPRISTFDNSASPTDDDQRQVVVPSVDKGYLESIIGGAIEEAKANDPKELRRQVMELKDKLFRHEQLSKSKPVADAAAQLAKQEDMKRSYEAGHKDGYKSAKDKIAFALDNTVLWSRVGRAAGDMICKDVKDLLGDERVKLGDAHFGPYGIELGKPESKQQMTTSDQALLGEWGRKFESMGKKEQDKQIWTELVMLNDYQKDLLRVALTRFPIRTPFHQIATLANKSTKSSALKPNLNELVKKGMLVKEDGSYLATDEAFKRFSLELLGDIDSRPPVSGPEALKYWIDKLPSYQGKVLKAVSTNGGLGLDEIASATGFSKNSSAFKPAINSLVKLQFLVKDGFQYILGDVFKR